MIPLKCEINNSYRVKSPAGRAYRGAKEEDIASQSHLVDAFGAANLVNVIGIMKGKKS